MTRHDKARPTSLDPLDPLRVVLDRAAAGDIDETLSIDLRVTGGMPPKAYRLEHHIGGDLSARTLFLDERTGRNHDVDSTEIERDDLSEVARRIVESGLVDVPADPPRFLPDTVVGVIVISDGEHTFRAYFAADPDQASVQEVTPRPEVLQAASAMYASAGRLMGEKSVGP